MQHRASVNRKRLWFMIEAPASYITARLQQQLARFCRKILKSAPLRCSHEPRQSGGCGGLPMGRRRCWPDVLLRGRCQMLAACGCTCCGGYGGIAGAGYGRAKGLHGQSWQGAGEEQQQQQRGTLFSCAATKASPGVEHRCGYEKLLCWKLLKCCCLAGTGGEARERIEMQVQEMDLCGSGPR